MIQKPCSLSADESVQLVLTCCSGSIPSTCPHAACKSAQPGLRQHRSHKNPPPGPPKQAGQRQADADEPLCRVRPVIVSLTVEIQRAPRVTTLFLALLPLNAEAQLRGPTPGHVCEGSGPWAGCAPCACRLAPPSLASCAPGLASRCGGCAAGKACCHVGLQSPAVAQEVDDVWRGHRVPLSLSTPGNVQRPSQADRGQRAEEVGEPVGTCLENRPRPGQEPHLHPLESDPKHRAHRHTTSVRSPCVSHIPFKAASHSLASVLGDAEVAPQPRASLQVELAGTSRPLPSIPRTAPSLLSPDPSAVTVAQPGLLMSVLPHHRSLLSALAYRLEPVSARYQGPHTHTHCIPPLAARGEGEVNISPNGWDSLLAVDMEGRSDELSDNNNTISSSSSTVKPTV
ncbi:hypothetical protein JOQ06_015266 [Pogonophryne albipinna]|uniref:Uncharacterized protein n=1 Tax=Pogonophryne albipinna TaxID=1090488 RepID=A0AAD6FAA5_9TELE|nr:hypothetical protein JOQ06_015266 [Pogonophryne albipinna]